MFWLSHSYLKTNNVMMPTRTIALGDIITKEEVQELIEFVYHNRGKNRLIRNIVLAWVEKHPAVIARFRQYGIIKHFGAYLIQHHLELE